MSPLVSILIPAYNAQAWISDTIKSALVQTWARKEIIIVDDGSSDETLSIARLHASPQVKVITQKNLGACAARNRAFHECQGDYIQWLDADDLLAPDKIELQLDVASNDMPSDVLFSSAWGTFFYRPKKAKFRPTPLWQDLDAVEWLVFKLSNPWIMPTANWLVSRRLSDEAGLWDERLLRNQDGEYFCRVVSLSSHVKFVLESKYYYRKANPASITRKRSRKTMESHCLSFELEVCHVLSRQDSPQTRVACAKWLNKGVGLLENVAEDLADRLRKRVIELGGKCTVKSTSRKYEIVERMLGRRRARDIKDALWRTELRMSCIWDRLLGQLFGTDL